MRLFIAALSLLLWIEASHATPANEAEAWRAKRAEKLKAPDGWLSLAGLFWLKGGENTVGSAKNSKIRLPEGSTPSRVGTLNLGSDGLVTFKPESGSPMIVKTDDPGPPDIIRINDRISFSIIRRSKGLGVRVKDTQAPTRLNFKGLTWYPFRESARVEARLDPAPGKIRVPNILGGDDEWESPGSLVFSLDGKEHRLLALKEEDHLFVIFKDATSGKTTYPAGRYLNADMPKDGKTILDFNIAYNPPCVFTPYATCTLPPKQNRLRVPIEAGETFSGH